MGEVLILRAARFGLLTKPFGRHTNRELVLLFDGLAICEEARAVAIANKVGRLFGGEEGWAGSSAAVFAAAEQAANAEGEKSSADFYRRNPVVDLLTDDISDLVRDLE